MTTATTTLSRPAPRTVSVPASSLAFIGRSMRHSLRDGEGLLMAIALPVMLMLLFTTVFGGAIQGDGYIDYVVPGIILTCAGFGASGVAVSVSRDMTAGAMKRYRTLPIVSATVLVGHTIASLARNLVATAVVIGVAFAMGFRPGAGPLEWLAVIGLVAAYVLAITALFAFIGLVAGSPEAANGYGFVLLFLPYLSSAFVPIATMPGWLQPVATHQPVTPIIEALRALLLGGEVGPYGLVALAWCAGILLVAALLTRWRFPRTSAR
ncbi:ABC transporter permease [Propionibacteriaceae bacterium Y2011]|uniref:ABC transporter permease n=1 Tax=Microlunatus sp. Y2014 TaxID=3418488 RepID=UPI003B4741FC